ncbi:hypothetical protein AAZX31_05G164300 [Glycine max]
MSCKSSYCIRHLTRKVSHQHSPQRFIGERHVGVLPDLFAPHSGQYLPTMRTEAFPSFGTGRIGGCCTPYSGF